MSDEERDPTIKVGGEVWKQHIGTKWESTCVETIWGSFVNPKEYGMAQAKNAIPTRKRLRRAGYKRVV